MRQAGSPRFTGQHPIGRDNALGVVHGTKEQEIHPDRGRGDQCSAGRVTVKVEACASLVLEPEIVEIVSLREISGLRLSTEWKAYSPPFVF